MARIPAWWLVVGVDTANRLGDLFAQVMQDLPMSQAELAKSEKVDVDQSTVARWAKGRTTPDPDIMLKAVQEVRAHLERLERRASVVEEALQQVVAVEEEADPEAKHEATARVQELLDELED